MGVDGMVLWLVVCGWCGVFVCVDVYVVVVCLIGWLLFVMCIG